MAALTVSIESTDGGGILSRCQWGIAAARERKDTNGKKKSRFQTRMNPMRRNVWGNRGKCGNAALWLNAACAGWKIEVSKERIAGQKGRDEDGRILRGKS